MRGSLRYLFALCLALNFWLLSGCALPNPELRQAPMPAPRRGHAMPNVKIKDLKGKTFRLTSLKGEALLINFWATWCVTCVAEMQALQRLHSHLKDHGFKVVGISLDEDAEQLRNFVINKKLSFPIFRDAYGEARRAFAAVSLPITFLIDRDGRLVYFSDAPNMSPTLSVTGARSWDAPRTVAQLQAIVEEM